MDQVALVEVLPSAQPGAAHAAAIEDMSEGALDQLAAPAHGLAPDIRSQPRAIGVDRFAPRLVATPTARIRRCASSTRPLPEPSIVRARDTPCRRPRRRAHPRSAPAVRNLLSFRRFCGIPLDQETPDHSSIWRFRQRIEKLGLSEKLLAEVNRQLDARGLIVKRGTLVDATIIAAAVKPPSFEEGVVSERDPDASFTVKNDETSFGYKAHLAVDEESGLVRQAEMTSADLHDSQRGEAMIQGDEAAYYADKAYDSQALRDKLGELGIEDRIAYKAKRNKPLVNWQVWFNKTASRIRLGVATWQVRRNSAL